MRVGFAVGDPRAGSRDPGRTRSMGELHGNGIVRTEIHQTFDVVVSAARERRAGSVSLAVGVDDCRSTDVSRDRDEFSLSAAELLRGLLHGRLTSSEATDHASHAEAERDSQGEERFTHGSEPSQRL